MSDNMELENGQNKPERNEKPDSRENDRWRKVALPLIILFFLAMAACIIGLAVALAEKNKHKSSEVTVWPVSTAIQVTSPEVTVSPPASTTIQMTPPKVTQSPLVSTTIQATKKTPTSATGLYRYVTVAADNKLCSQIGTEIMLLQGGSAADATIASLVCLGVLNAHSMGIGGGFLLTMYDKSTKKVISLNSREVAPGNATEEMFVNTTDASVLGGLAVAVPSEIAGYGELHQKYGKVPWKDLFAPTIKLCKEGVPLPKAMSVAIKVQEQAVRSQQGLRKLFVKPDGSLMVEGDLMKRPKLAETLQRIANEGASAFYNGQLADDIVADIAEAGGIVSKEDLLGYKPVWKEPVSTKLNNGGYTLYGPPPPSSAAVLYYILNIMDGFNLTKADRLTVEGEILVAHRLVEAMKFGYGKRSFLGDEDFVNVTEWKDLLLDDAYAAQARSKINDMHTLNFSQYESAFEVVNDGGTSHLSVLDANGMAIAVTSTINTHFGSKVVGNRTGIVFNNEMDDFSTPGLVNNFGVSASPTNYIAPGKRPMSSMSPTIFMDSHGELAGIVGASGGTRIITGTLETILNNIWLGYNVTEALDQLRFHHQLLPNEILHEPAWSQHIIEGLRKKGHTFKIRELEFCVVQFVRLLCNVPGEACISAGSDARKGGAPDGY